MRVHVEWFDATAIQPQHATLPVRQVYGWIVSKNTKLVLVSKNGKDWQLPGGKPEPTETLEQTFIREVREETGLDIGQPYGLAKSIFGYRKVTEGNEMYLQVRYVALPGYTSHAVALKPEEDGMQPEPDKVKFAKWVGLSEAETLIPWLGISEEYAAFRRALAERL